MYLLFPLGGILLSLSGVFTPSFGKIPWLTNMFQLGGNPHPVAENCCKPLFLWKRFYRGDESKDMTVRTSNSRLVCQPIKARTCPLKGSI